VIVSGGGARNPALLDALRAQLPAAHVAISDEFGIDADAKEALAFAVLGAMTLHERAAGLPQVTGAAGSRLLGAIAPQGLAVLLERLRREAGAEGRPARRSTRSDLRRSRCGGTATVAAVSSDGVYLREVRGEGANPTTRGIPGRSASSRRPFAAPCTGRRRTAFTSVRPAPRGPP